MVQTQVSQTESVFLAAERKVLKIAHCSMQAWEHAHIAILFLEVLGLSLSQATKIIS